MSSVVNRRTMISLIGAGSLALVAGCRSEESGADANGPNGPPSLPQELEKYGVPPALLAVTVYKDPSCGCCGDWVAHAEEHGFSVVIEHPDVLGAVFAEHKVPVALQSCHLTRNATGAVFVGHVPAEYILDYLADPPRGSRGLTVPDMPVGAPGMEVGARFDPYEVLLLLEDGSTEVFATVSEAVDQQS